ERAAGNLQFRSNVDYDSGELGQLAMSFDNMADTLEKQNNERIKVENSLRESEERFRNLFEHSPVSLWWEDHSEIKKHIDQLRAAGIEDFKTYFQLHPEEVAKCVTMLNVIAVNEATLNLYEAKSKENLLEGFVKIFKKESYRVFTEELIALTAGKTEFECEASTQTLTGKRNYVIFKLLILPGYEGTWSKVLVSMTDITERKKIEEERNKLFLETKEASKQLRIISRRLLEIEEEERKSISRELHDEIGQTLTTAKINLQSIQKTNKSNKTRKELDVPISYITQSLQQVRDISLNLRPSVLDDLGIEPALKWLINRFVESTKIKFELQFVAAKRIASKELELTCYRITQEALTNIVKYAEANNVVVCLAIEDNSLHLKITDDGKGFDVEDARTQALKGKSLGILSMEERTKLTGGEFKIISTEKSGTEVEAIFPLPKS
ncbi:MAG: histidine kinase, partial [Paludibacter sp.]